MSGPAGLGRAGLGRPGLARSTVAKSGPDERRRQPSPTVAVAAFVAACWAAGLVTVVIRRLAVRRSVRADPV